MTSKNEKVSQSWEDFYPYYLCEHTKPTTKLIHVIATFNALSLWGKSAAGPWRWSLLGLGLLQVIVYIHTGCPKKNALSVRPSRDSFERKVMDSVKASLRKLPLKRANFLSMYRQGLCLKYQIQGVPKKTFTCFGRP